VRARFRAWRDQRHERRVQREVEILEMLAREPPRPPRRIPVLTRRQERKRARVQAEVDALVREAEVLQPSTRRIWLDPDYWSDPVVSDVEERLSHLVWTSRTLPIPSETQHTLLGFIEHYDEAYLGDDENVHRAVQEEALALVRRLRAELGPEWAVGFFSQSLERPVWDLAEIPDDEWRLRFTRFDDK
jgi:hypothetical protein